jgi:hypothetical protein
MFIDTEPLICTAMNELGVMSMLLCQPIRKFGWKDPTEPPRPWTTVTDTI